MGIRQKLRAFPVLRQIDELRRAILQLRATAGRNLALCQDAYQRRLQASPRYQEERRLQRHEWQVLSQNGEDGIIQEIFRRIGTTNQFFVEVGVGDGLENCTANLIRLGWSGIWIDGDAGSLRKARSSFSSFVRCNRLRIVEALVSDENIQTILTPLSIPSEPDLASLDIDRNTYHLWQAMNLRPRAVVIEYNSAIPADEPWVVDRAPEKLWNGSIYFGASLKALERLGETKGYKLVGCDLSGTNAFFVRADLVDSKFAEPFTAENHFEPPRYFLYRQVAHPHAISDAG